MWYLWPTTLGGGGRKEKNSPYLKNVTLKRWLVDCVIAMVLNYRFR